MTFNLLLFGVFLNWSFGIGEAFSMNSTGGTFPQMLMQEATFAYELSCSNLMNYFDGGSITAKCNIMGYWHIGNTNPAAPHPPTPILTTDTKICTDICTVSTCGYDSSSSRRVDNVQRFQRNPIVDFSISEMPFSLSDYSYYPDLQMYPAFAGAVVPVINVPELGRVPLTLSRSTLAAIFMGRIRHWNDSAILSDNTNTSAHHILASITSEINVVVRQDSSGISMILAQALSLFDPPTRKSRDFSFGNTVGKGPQGKPAWCGLLTDEVQIYSVKGCSKGQMVEMAFLDSTHKIKGLNWRCNASAADLVRDFSQSLSVSVTVTKKFSSASTWSYQVGFSDLQLMQRNWYQPQLIYSHANVTIRTLQEGGMWNAHYNVSNYYVTPEVQSLFVINGTALLLSFTCTSPSAPLGTAQFVTTSNVDTQSSADLSAQIQQAISSTCLCGAISVTRTKTSGSSTSLVEYQITFSQATQHVDLKVNALYKLTGSSAASSVNLFVLLSPNNYPLFKDPAYKGVSSGGRYTCYNQYLGYVPFSFYAASLLQLNAMVESIPYSIGYSTIDDANSYSLQIPLMINKAGSVVSASSDSVAFAAMESGGNLDQHLNAVLVDGASLQAWPIVGYNYFMVRLDSHVGTCSQRQTAMQFLYDYYDNDIIKAIAKQMSLAVVPDFIGVKIRALMVTSIKCKDGTLALEKYAKQLTLIASSAAIAPTVKTYLSSYASINAQISWNLTTAFHSSLTMDGFQQFADSYVGAFTLFSSKESKVRFLSDKNFLTNAFAHVAVAILYRLDALPTPLRVTPTILAGIFSGSIQHWNDAAIQAANQENKAFLPATRIKVVVRSVPSDTNSIFLRYLSLASPAFVAAYPSAAGTDYRYVNFTTRIDADRLIDAQTTNKIDSAVTYHDGSIGYFILDSKPMSSVAGLCMDATCGGYGGGGTTVPNPAIFPDDGGVSIEACTHDKSTVVNASTNLNSFDLMVSKAKGCYPIVGTMDWTVYQGQSESCPSTSSSSSPLQSSADSIVETRVKMSEWLYSGPKVVRPLLESSIGPTAAKYRSAAHKQVCNIQCGGVAMGYEYCGYRDCSLDAGDYDQVVSACDSNTAMRVVSYELKNGSTCIVNPTNAHFVKSTKITCTFTPFASPLGLFQLTLIILGMLICGGSLALTYVSRRDPVLKRSQLVFVYFFHFGAMALLLTMVVFWGPASDALCLSRPWAFDLAASFMVAPMVMKLHRVDTIFNNPTLKKMTVTNWQVGRQILMVLLVDIVILILWTVIDRPRAVVVSVMYPGVYGPVEDRVCNTGLTARFEVIMLGYKCLLIAFAVMKAVRTWSIPSDISEAKYFAVAIYNIAIIGGIGYFLGSFLGMSDPLVGNTLRCIGIWASTCVSVIVIMVPKLMLIEALGNVRNVFRKLNIKIDGNSQVRSGKAYVVPIDGRSTTTTGVRDDKASVSSFRLQDNNNDDDDGIIATHAIRHLETIAESTKIPTSAWTNMRKSDKGDEEKAQTKGNQSEVHVFNNELESSHCEELSFESHMFTRSRVAEV